MTTTTTPNPVLPVRLPGRSEVRPERHDRLLIVSDPEIGDVPVRWRMTLSPMIWRCSVCGPQEAASCPHTFAAGLYLAEQLLGLEPIDTKETP